MSKNRLDFITLAVLRSGLINTVAEMKAVVVRTAYSNLWKEAGDLSCGLFDQQRRARRAGKGGHPGSSGIDANVVAGMPQAHPARNVEAG